MKQALELALEALKKGDYALVNAICEELKQAQPEQEPVASIFISGIGEREFDDWGHDLPVGRNLLYTTPPERKPMTDEEIGAILEGVNAYGTRLYTFARAIEAAHGIKE